VVQLENYEVAYNIRTFVIVITKLCMSHIEGIIFLGELEGHQ